MNDEAYVICLNNEGTTGFIRLFTGKQGIAFRITKKGALALDEDFVLNPDSKNIPSAILDDAIYYAAEALKWKEYWRNCCFIHN